MTDKGPHSLTRLSVSDVPPTISEAPPKPSKVSGIWRKSSAGAAENLEQLTGLLGLFEDRNKDAVNIFAEQIEILCHPQRIVIHKENSEVQDLTPPANNYAVITNDDNSVSLFIPFNNVTAEIIFEPGEAEKIHMDIWLRIQTLIAVAAHEIRKENINKKAAQNLAAIIHDIRNALAPLFTLLEYTDVDNIFDDESYRKQMLTSISTAINLCTQGMNLSLDQAGNTKIRIRPTQLDELLQNIAAIFINKCQIENYTGLKIIETDPNHLERVIFNLVQNAVKFSESSEEPIEITIYKEKDQLVIEVRDYGPGFSIQSQQLFEYFRSGYEDKSNGYGIGLGYCKKIIETMGGTIEAKNNNPKGNSSHPEGATFTIKLPLNASTTTDQ